MKMGQLLRQMIKGLIEISQPKMQMGQKFGQVIQWLIERQAQMKVGQSVRQVIQRKIERAIQKQMRQSGRKIIQRTIEVSCQSQIQLKKTRWQTTLRQTLIEIQTKGQMGDSGRKCRFAFFRQRRIEKLTKREMSQSTKPRRGIKIQIFESVQLVRNPREGQWQLRARQGKTLKIIWQDDLFSALSKISNRPDHFFRIT